MPIEQIHTQQAEQVTPLISFIITTYNLPYTLLKECIESVIGLSLRLREMEIILVDDGSIVSVIDDLREYRDDILYIRQRNKGLSGARNTGLSIASGMYIQFIDGDDFIIKAPYEHCLDIVRYNNPDMVLFNETRNKVAKTPLSSREPITGSEFMRVNNLHATVCGYIFKRELLGDLRFTQRSLAEDEEFTPQLILRAKRLFATSADAYYYRRRPDSLTNTKDKQHKLNRLEDMERTIIKLRHIATALNGTEKEALNRRVAQLTMDYLYGVIRKSHSGSKLEETIERLRKQNLFPLPDKAYTNKYILFRRVISTKMGRKLLLIILR